MKVGDKLNAEPVHPYLQHEGHSVKATGYRYKRGERQGVCLCTGAANSSNLLHGRLWMQGQRGIRRT